jgi:voltage-gated sodium channel
LDAQFAAVFRLARALRLLRLVTAVPKLQLLVGALLKSLGAMGYVTLLLAMVFYIYGVAGVHLFGSVDPKHFGSLSAALLSLFRLITLDNWADIFQSVSIDSRLPAVLYFVSFIMLGTMIMLNLFIGIIMNSMAEMHNEMAESERTQHLAKAGRITIHDELVLFEQKIDQLRRHAARLRQRAGTKV